MGMFDSVSYVALNSALDGLAQRQRQIADNIANVNTPGYQAGRVQFEEELARSAARGDGNVRATTALSLEPTRTDGNNVNRYDPRLNSFRQVPLAQTPLSTFLAREVRLDQGVRIDRVTRMESGAYAITARDARRPNEGSVILAFAGGRLQEWTITDAQGARTRLQLTTLQPASGLSASLFQLRDPTRRPSRDR